MQLATIFKYLTFVSIAVIGFGGAQLTSDTEELLNWCLDAKHHKSKPGPENSLYGQCTPWKNRSCCTEVTTRALHESSLYNFNYDHCQDKKKLSPACRKHFMQDHCFYECSPNVGPWVVKENRSWRKERYYKVPLCESDCIAWFKDCKDDYTCTDNWSMNFKWVNATYNACNNGKSCKINICPPGARCQTFAQIFKDPKNFCERIWDNSWEFTDDTQPCMRMWFDGSSFNPNDQIAALKASYMNASNYLMPSLLTYIVFVASYMILLS